MLDIGCAEYLPSPVRYIGYTVNSRENSPQIIFVTGFIMKIHHLYNKLLLPFRQKRMMRFMRTFTFSAETKILDIGGTPYNWHLVNCPAQITLLNLNIPNPLPELPANITCVHGDGMKLHFSDNSFDIVFSNSVIEHLFSFKNQEKFSSEIRRVGKQIWVQTPARTFFFEPHFLTPFFHYLPKKLQTKLARNFTVWGWITRPTDDYVKNMVQEINLLAFSEFQELFSDCFIQKEMFFGMTKAFIAIRKMNEN